MTENQVIAIVVMSILAFNALWLMVFSVIYFVSRRKEAKNLCKIVYPKSFLALCIGIELVGNALIAWLLASKQDNALGFGLVPLPLLGTVSITICLNWQIVLEDDRFIFRNSWRKVRIYQLSDVTEILCGVYGANSSVFVCVGKERIRLEIVLSNREVLLTRLKQLGVPINSTFNKGNHN